MFIHISHTNSFNSYWSLAPRQCAIYPQGTPILWEADPKKNQNRYIIHIANLSGMGGYFFFNFLLVYLLSDLLSDLLVYVVIYFCDFQKHRYCAPDLSIDGMSKHWDMRARTFCFLVVGVVFDVLTSDQLFLYLYIYLDGYLYGYSYNYL